MIRSISQFGAPVLKSLARAIDPKEVTGEEIQGLIGDMMETLTASGGVGLAAPQVGESLRLILAGSFPTAKYPDRPEIPVAALINPRIVVASDETEEGWEGCLSFLEFRVRVLRHARVVVEYLSPDGSPGRVEATDFYARVLQHEIDHLDGILTLDRARAPDDIRPNDS